MFFIIYILLYVLYLGQEEIITRILYERHYIVLTNSYKFVNVF